jgi:signal recognition particle receptor subunit beta
MVWKAASEAPPASRTAPGAAGGEDRYVPSGVAGAAKILVVGPLGVGKTTLIGAVSEIRPLSTEAVMTQAGARTDQPGPSGPSGPGAKSTTTVALDFGRITLGGELVLYLFGTPGQQRFLPAWRDMARGALGALALVDTRDLGASFDALGNLEDLGLPFAVAVNDFPGRPQYTGDELRDALDLLPGTPLVECDARDRRSATLALIALTRHLLDLAETGTEIGTEIGTETETGTETEAPWPDGHPPSSGRTGTPGSLAPRPV